MSADFDPTALPPEFYASKIKSLETKVAELDERLAEYDKLRHERAEAAKELEFWRLGRDLFVGEPAPEISIRVSGGGGTRIVGGRTANGSGSGFPAPERPPLREAIKTVMREGDRNGWRARDLYVALKDRGWEPQGKSPTDAIGAMLAGMFKRREIFKLEPGLYSLTPATQLLPDGGDDD